MKEIPVVDLFAGPGGLNEGFSAYRGLIRFRLALAIEKDPAAHRTLELRHFFRQFPQEEVPELYYRYVKGEGIAREDLFRAFPDEAEKAAGVAWLCELGVEPLNSVLSRIEDAIEGACHWVLLGGPPCQAYSIVGRARMKNMSRFGNDQRHVLYREYMKIVAAFQPIIFVMENVKGILSSRFRDVEIFRQILEDMKDPWNALDPSDRRRIPSSGPKRGYRIYSFSTPYTGGSGLRPEDYVIESEKYGIPQKRHRVILLGIRDDYDLIPPVLEEVYYPISVKDVIEGIPAIRSGLSRGPSDGDAWVAAVFEGLDSMVFPGVSDKLASEIKAVLQRIRGNLDTGARFVPGGVPPRRLARWLFDPRIGGVLQHESKSHMQSDLHRYFFAACFARVYGRSPKISDFPRPLWPNHANAVPDEHGRVRSFEDRFRVQLWNQPATTITSHLEKDGHYFIHPDPLQCRSLTVREAARLQTFPDNYFFEGNRGDQYRQIGNAVPPFLAFQMADVVAEILENCIDRDVERSTTANVVYVTR